MEIIDNTTQSSKKTKSTRRRKSYLQKLTKIIKRDRRKSFELENSPPPTDISPSHTYNTRRRKAYLQTTQKNRKETMDNNRQTAVNQESLPSFTNLPKNWPSFTTNVPIEEIKKENKFTPSKREINKRKAFPRRSLSPIDDSDMEIEPDTIFDPYEMNPVVTNLPPIHYIILMHGVTLENKIKIPYYNKRKITIHFYLDEGNVLTMPAYGGTRIFKTLCSFNDDQFILPHNSVYSGNVIYDIRLIPDNDMFESIGIETGLYICDGTTQSLKMIAPLKKGKKEHTLSSTIDYIFLYHHVNYKNRHFKISSINCRSYDAFHPLFTQHQEWRVYPTSYAMDDTNIIDSIQNSIIPDKFSHLHINSRMKIWDDNVICNSSYRNYTEFMEDVLQELNNPNTKLFFHDETYDTIHRGREDISIVNLCKQLKEDEVIFVRFSKLSPDLDVDPPVYMLLMKKDNNCMVYNKLTDTLFYMANDRDFVEYIQETELFTFQILHEKI